MKKKNHSTNLSVKLENIHLIVKKALKEGYRTKKKDMRHRKQKVKWQT